MARLVIFEQGKSATVAGSYDSFEQDYDLADTDCELTVAEEDEEEAVVEKDSDLARAVSELKFATSAAEKKSQEGVTMFQTQEKRKVKKVSRPGLRRKEPTMIFTAILYASFAV